MNMQIRQITTINKSTNGLLTKVKKYFYTGKLKLKTLLKDVFERSKPEVETKMSENYPYPRKLPNSFSAPDEVFSKGNGSGKVKFYPEDIKKMENMTVTERLQYGEKLIKEGKYIE